MAYGLSNGHVTDDVTMTFDLKSQIRDPNMLTAQYLENGWRQRRQTQALPIGNGICAIKWSRDR